MAKQINLGRFRGEDAKINGVNTLTIQGGDGIHVHQAGSELTISADGFGSHIHDYNNPHRVTKSQVGLGNVDNKSESTIIADMKESLVPSDITEALGYTPADTTKAMTPQQVNVAIASAITVKQDVLTGVQGQLVGFDSEGNATAVPGITLVVDDRMIPGSANPVQSQVIQAALADATGDISDLEGDVSALGTRVGTVETNLNAHTSNTNNPHSVTKAQVGLGNVDNKSEATIISDAKAQIMTSANITTALGYTAAKATDLTALTTRVGNAETTIGQHTTSISNLNSSVNLLGTAPMDVISCHTVTVTFTGPTGDTEFPKPDNMEYTVMHGAKITVQAPYIEGYVPTDTTVTTVVNRDKALNFQYRKSTALAELRIHYVGPTGDTSFPQQSDYVAMISVGASYTAISPVIEGYQTSTPSVSGEMVAGGVEVTVSYTKKTARLHIIYMVPTGYTAPSEVDTQVTVGTTYSVASPSVAGLTPNIATVTGTMPDTTVTIVVQYEPALVTITLRYIPLGRRANWTVSSTPGYQGQPSTVNGFSTSGAWYSSGVTTTETIPSTMTTDEANQKGWLTYRTKTIHVKAGSEFVVPEPHIWMGHGTGGSTQYIYYWYVSSESQIQTAVGDQNNRQTIDVIMDCKMISDRS